VSFVKEIQYYSHLMKMLIVALNVIMFITIIVGKKEIFVPNVKELKDDPELINILLKYDLKINLSNLYVIYLYNLYTLLF